MEETLASPKMSEIDLINNLEKISSEIPNRILKLEGFILKENQKEKLFSNKFIQKFLDNESKVSIKNKYKFTLINFESSE